MKNEKPTVAVVDDEEHILKTMGICLESAGFEVSLYADPEAAAAAFATKKFDLAFVDLKMAPIDGMQLLERIRRDSPPTTVTMITAHGSLDTAIEAVKRGAYYYLQKPFDFQELQLFSLKALEYHNLSWEVRSLRARVADTGSFVTRNKTMLDTLSLAEQVADSPITVLIEGESGTGKELIAQFIHDRSTRTGKPFVKVNCAALPTELLESELFGHVKGAFTGATRDRQGRFEAADGGTLFLDEIAEVSPAIQVKLLRVIQSKEFERVGDNATRRVDARIIAATNRNLKAALENGEFREDLFYRLNAVRLKALPLRERPEDIPLLVEHFTQKIAAGRTVRVEPEAMAMLRAYAWPGNVRELENAMERAVLLSRGGAVGPDLLPEELTSSLETGSAAMTLEDVEKAHIRKVLARCSDYEEAARLLGIDRSTLWRKREKYGL
ncbi:sigma-54-dependent Fis family transcriptional regulator [bacterium]|nr:sigma-54-dependent Fis family transcriptional regulator [bacterium]